MAPARERGHDRELQPQRQGLEWQDPGSRDDDRRYQQVLPALRADLGRLCALSGQGRSPIDIAYSDNKGANWTGPVRVSDSNNQLVHDARPGVSPNGDALMTWTNGPNEKSLTNNMATADISHDDGANWGTDATVAPIPGAYSGLPNSLYRDSTDLVDCTGDNSRL